MSAETTSLMNSILNFDGYDVQAYLLVNIDLIGYIASVYLVMVGQGVPITRWLLRNRSADFHSEKSVQSQLSGVFRLSSLFHWICASISAVCAAYLGLVMTDTISADGFYTAVCAWSDARLYLGPAGFTVCVAVVMKMVELIDTLFLVYRDYTLQYANSTAQRDQLTAQLTASSQRRITVAHWWSHVLMALYFWHTFSIGISTFTAIALVSVACGVARHAALAMEDGLTASRIAAGKPVKSSATLPFDVLSIASQIAECVGVSAVAIYSSYQNYTAEKGCLTMQANVRMCAIIYLSWLCLIFYQIVHPKRAASSKPKANQEKKSK